MCAISPSGQGLKIFYRTAILGGSITNKKLFTSIWGALKTMMEQHISSLSLGTDQSQKSPHSGFFMTWDTKAIYNPNCPTIDLMALEPYMKNSSKKNEVGDRVPKKKMDLNTSISSNSNSKQNNQPLDPKFKHPSKEEIKLLISWMPPKKINSAIDQIEKYFQVPIGAKKRYSAFFETASHLCMLGKNNGKQQWELKVFSNLLNLIDYDSSRDEKNQIASTIDSLVTYGHWDQLSTHKITKNCVNTNQHLRHLDTFATPDVIMQTQKYISERKDELFEILQANRLVGILSRTASGKSTWALTELPKTFDGHIYFLVPTVSIKDQLLSKWKHLDYIEFLGKGDKVNNSKRVHVLTFEKMTYLLQNIQDKKNTMVLVDEAHVLGGDFRKKTMKVLISWMTETSLNHVRWILMSATIQSFLTTLKHQIPELFYIEIRNTRPMPKVVINLVEDTQQFLVQRISSILETISACLKQTGISSLIVSRDTKEEEAVTDLWDQKGDVKESVLLCTSVAECGVELTMCTHTLVCGEVSTDSLVQMSDRTRRDDAPVELIMKKRVKEDFFFDVFLEKNVKAYIQKISSFKDLELAKLKVAYGKTDVSWQRINELVDGHDNVWGKLNNDTFDILNRGNTENCISMLDTFMAKFVGKSNNSHSQDMYTLSVNVQGIAKNLLVIEKKNENNLEYFRQKLKFLWGIETVVYLPTYAPCLKQPPETDLLELLRSKMKIVPELIVEAKREAELILQVEGVPKIQIDRIFRLFEYRDDFCLMNNLSTSKYLLLSPTDFGDLKFHCSIRNAIDPLISHPIPLAMQNHLSKQGLWGVGLHATQIRDIIVDMHMHSSTEHIRSEVLSHSDQAISKLFRSLFVGSETRKKINGKKLRLFFPTHAAWEHLVSRGTT